MANKVLLKKSSVGARVPTTGDVDYGELALNYADGKLYYKTSGNAIDSFPSLTATATLTNKTLTSPTITSPTLSGGTINNTTIGGTTPAAITGTTLTSSTGDIVSANALVSNNSIADEGGEIRLAKAVTNTTLNTSVTIDIYQNKFRIFETGGTNRGAYIDIAAATAGVGTNLIAAAGGGTVTSITAGTGLTGGTISTSGTIAINSTVATLTGAQTLTNKSLTSPTVTGTLTAGGGVGTSGQILSSTGSGIQWVDTSVDPVTTLTKSLNLTTDWQDTGISYTDLSTGTYIIQLYANDTGAGGSNSNEYYSGTMSWYAGATNSSVELPTDEIPLHRAGQSSEGGLYLRTFRSTSGSGTNLKLQIYANMANSSASNYVFKFRKMI